MRRLMTAALAAVLMLTTPTVAYAEADPVVVAAGVKPGEREPHSARATVNRIVEAATIPPAQWRDFVECVEHRESNGQPGVVNASGHMGLFQFSRDWMPGLSWVVQRALILHGMRPAAAREMRRVLAAKSIQHWPAKYQRIGIAQVLREGGRAAAMRHWSLPGSRCQGLMA